MCLFCEVRMTIESVCKEDYSVQGMNTGESSTSAKDRDLLLVDALHDVVYIQSARTQKHTY